MEYQAVTHYLGMTHNGSIRGSETAAIEDVIKALPDDCNDGNVILIVYHVYNNERNVSYVTTLSKYRVAIS